MFEETIQFIRSTFNTSEFIPLHEPRFIGNEINYITDSIQSTFVSSVGQFVDKFETIIAAYTGAKYAVATVSGTAALHTSLLLANVQKGDEVLTQPLTFVSTCNAIRYCDAAPVFIDVDRDTMGLSPKALKDFLEEHCCINSGRCINKKNGRVIRACLPMHTFGHPCRIEEIKVICDNYNITLIEDAAESLGSYYKGKHTGTFGQTGTISFNGNKIITAGGGGCILTNDEVLAKRAKHLTTTAKIPHKWEYAHDTIAYNYRMPNLNAALLIAQIEQLDMFLENKRELASIYQDFFNVKRIQFFAEPRASKSNYWLNTVILRDKTERDLFLNETNSKGIMTRPIWTLMNKLKMFADNQCGNLKNALWIEKRAVNIPSSVRL